MNGTEHLLKKIIEGIQEKKGQSITVVDLRKVNDAICSYFVICQGGSTTHVSAICNSIVDYVREQINDKPIAIDGRQNLEWVAIDYGSIMAHVFLPAPRDYYKLEQLWSDARLNHIEDIY